MLCRVACLLLRLECELLPDVLCHAAAEVGVGLLVEARHLAGAWCVVVACLLVGRGQDEGRGEGRVGGLG